MKKIVYILLGTFAGLGIISYGLTMKNEKSVTVAQAPTTTAQAVNEEMAASAEPVINPTMENTEETAMKVALVDPVVITAPEGHASAAKTETADKAEDVVLKEPVAATNSILEEVEKKNAQEPQSDAWANSAFLPKDDESAGEFNDAELEEEIVE